MSKYPKVVDEKLVGKYSALAKSGAGYFFDDVLEYRVWCYPRDGAKDHYDGDVYYHPFSNYEEALSFSESTTGAGEPLVLIKQLEWVNEPEEGVFIHEKGERIAEWLPAWLSRGVRIEGDIEKFILEKTKHN